MIGVDASYRLVPLASGARSSGRAVAQFLHNLRLLGGRELANPFPGCRAAKLTHEFEQGLTLLPR